MSENYNLIDTLFCLLESGRLEINNPPLSRVMDAIRALNGVTVDTVGINLRYGDSMDIGGGKMDQYKCHVSTRNGIYDLINPNVPKDTNDCVPIMFNDEVHAYPRCTIVSFETVMIAVQCFCTSGELSPNLTWDSTLDYAPL